jgi:hypothetical protein
VSRQQVLGQEQFTGATLETTKIDALALECHSTFCEATDLAYGDEEIAPLDADDCADDWWRGIVTEARDEVLDATDPVAVRIKDRSVQERGEVEKVSHQVALTVL